MLGHECEALTVRHWCRVYVRLLASCMRVPRVQTSIFVTPITVRILVIVSAVMVFVGAVVVYR